MSFAPLTCKKCPTLIVWAISAKTGKPMPVDARPAANGNIRLTHGQTCWVAGVLAGAALVAARDAKEHLHLNHFATCVHALEFRRPHG